MKTFFILCFSVLGLAAETPNRPMETDLIIYDSGIGNHFDAYLEALKRGYPLGTSEKKDSKSPDKDEDVDIGKIARALQEQAENLQIALVKSIQSSSAGFTPTTAGSASLPTNGKSKPLAAVPAWSKDSLPRFLKCAQENLVHLKKLLLAESQGASLSVDSLLLKINRTRGDGTNLTVGMVCGEHLGHRGLPVTDTIENVKLLLPIVSVMAGNRAEMLTRFSLYGKALKGKDTIAPAFWIYVWKRSALMAVFSQGTIPALGTLEKEFAALSTRTDSFEFKNTKVKLTATLPATWPEEVLQAHAREQAAVLSKEVR